MSKYESGWPASLYFIGVPGSGIVKIGYSWKPKMRLIRFRRDLGLSLEIIAEARFPETYQARWAERTLHKLFRDQRIAGEWFRVSPPIQHVINSIVPGELYEMV